MPITVTLPRPDQVVAPWSEIALSSDFIGAMPTGSYFQLGVDTLPDAGIPAIRLRFPFEAKTQLVTLSPESGDPAFVHWDPTAAWPDSTPVHVSAELVEGGGLGTIVDSGTATGPWQSTAQIALQPRESTTGGLTPEQDQSLTEVHASTFTDQLIDNLTLIALTSGPSAGPINSFLVDTTFGVIVRLAQIPLELEPGTPDGDYWGKTLAVVRVFRGSDLWQRYPIHTSNRMIPFVTHDVVAAVAALTATQWLLNMSIQVTFLPGVTGEVFLMRFP